jgi:hypothetical protein
LADPQPQTYTGGCHCGAVRFEFTGHLAGVAECNCSHCSKKGFLLAFVPAATFTLISGEDALTEYRFNKKHIAHRFCGTCGVQAFGAGTTPDGAEVRAINVRCVDDVDLDALPVTQVDGKSY